MNKVIYALGALTIFSLPAAGQDKQDAGERIATDGDGLHEAGPADASRESEDIWSTDYAGDYQTNDGNGNPLPFPDLGSGGSGGKVKIPGGKFPGGSIGDGIGGDHGGFGIAKGAQLDGPNLFRSGSKVKVEGATVTRLTSPNSMHEKPEEEDESEEGEE